MFNRQLRRSVVLAFAVASLAATNSLYAANITVSEGTICTNPGSAPIKDSQLSAWINQYIPAAANRLLVLTECFGGNTATAFTNQANTALISATMPGQEAKYGGYDSGASTALKPGAGRTGETVHQAGIATKKAGESPSQLGDGATGTPPTGNLNPANFSLAPVDPTNGPVKSRHVLVYAGQPGGPANNDVTQRNTITNNFAGQPGTTVTTVGDNGQNGWGQPATAAGLQSALKTIGNNISGSADPSKEQFIMFLTDHGDVNKAQKRTVTVNRGARTAVTDNSNTTNSPSVNSSLQCFDDSDFINSDQTPLDIFNSATTDTRGFSVSLDMSSTGNNDPMSTSALSSFFSTWSLDAAIQTGSNAGTDVTLTNPIVETTDFDGDSTIGNTPGEGVTLEFPLAAADMASSFFDVFTELDLTIPADTLGPTSWQVSDPSEDSGEIPPGTVPEPTSLLTLMGLGSLALLRRKHDADHIDSEFLVSVASSSCHSERRHTRRRRRI